jgi:hypothetical protein
MISYATLIKKINNHVINTNKNTHIPEYKLDFNIIKSFYNSIIKNNNNKKLHLLNIILKRETESRNETKNTL